MVSIIIPNYNGEKYLKACIEAVREQDYKDYEIILIDNNSTDSDYAWVQEESDIRFYKLDQNYGFSGGVNEGIKKARGKYILLLNNDTVVCPGFITALVKAIEKHEYIFGVSSKMIRYHEKHLIDDAGDRYNLLGWATKRGDGKSVDYYTEETSVFSICAGAALYRKDKLIALGGFDEAFFAYMEDVDLSYRALIHGYENKYCPEAKVYHIGSATSGSRHNAFKVHLAARNNLYVIYKNMPILQQLINLPFLSLGCLIKYMYFLKKGYGRAYAKGIVEGLKTCKSLDKVKYNKNHLKNYIKIQYLLIKNLLPERQA